MMDEVTLLILLGVMAFVLAVSLLLQIQTMRTIQGLKKRIAAVQSRPQEPMQRPSKIESTPQVVPKDMESLLKGHNSIEESIRALSELAHVEWITLATRDGLVVASNYQDAQQDAATYSDLMNRGGEPNDPGVKIWQIDHKSGMLIGIARSKEQIAGERWAFMRENVIKILNYWL